MHNCIAMNCVCYDNNNNLMSIYIFKLMCVCVCLSAPIVIIYIYIVSLSHSCNPLKRLFSLLFSLFYIVSIAVTWTDDIDTSKYDMGKSERERGKSATRSSSLDPPHICAHRTKQTGQNEWASSLRGCWCMSITAQLEQDNGIYILNIVLNSHSLPHSYSFSLSRSLSFSYTHSIPSLSLLISVSHSRV